MVLGISISILWILPNPYLHKHPLKNTKYLVSLGEKLMTSEVAPIEQRNTTWAKRLNRLIENGPERSGVLHPWIGLPSSLDKVVCAIGFFGLIPLGFKMVRNKKAINFLYLLIWFSIISIGIFLWTPFDWARWYIPMSPCWAILQGMGLFLIFITLRQLINSILKSTKTIKSTA